MMPCAPDAYARTRVYISHFLHVALSYSCGRRGTPPGGLYLVRPVGPLERDPDEPLTQTMCDSAVVLKEVTNEIVDWDFMGPLQPFWEEQFPEPMTFAELQLVVKNLAELDLAEAKL